MGTRDQVHWRHSTPGRYGCPAVSAKTGVKRTETARAITCDRCRRHIERILKWGGTKKQNRALEHEARRIVEWEEVGQAWLKELRRRREATIEQSHWDRRPTMTIERLVAVREFCARRLARMLERRPFQCSAQRTCEHPQCVLERIWQRGQFLAESALINTAAYRAANTAALAWDFVDEDPIPRRRHHSTFRVPYAVDGVIAIDLPRIAFERPLGDGALFRVRARVA